jgi:hypothetical protein
MLTREQVRILTGWSEGRLNRMVESGKLFEHPDQGIHPAEVYKASRKGREALQQLMQITTKTEGGRMFYEAFGRWQDLEEAGLIVVHRPVHEPTGVAYAEEHWWVELTPLGYAICREMEELMEDGYFL